MNRRDRRERKRYEDRTARTILLNLTEEANDPSAAKAPISY